MIYKTKFVIFKKQLKFVKSNKAIKMCVLFIDLYLFF